MRRLTLVTILGLLLLSLPALALDRTIYNGSDLWKTPGDGTTFADFSKQPLPAGFFCSKSEAFTGRIILQGVPLATGQPGVLGNTDTIVQRLDNAVFNKHGVAATRIQIRAMQFQSVAPVQTACGQYNAYVRLDGEQPITTMRILRDNEKGGRFFAPIYVNVKISFQPVGRTSTEVLELRKELRFPPAKNAQWSAARYSGAPREGFVKVDTDSDGVPDTFLPGVSNFAAGRAFQKYIAYTDPVTGCHVEDEGQHCPLVAY
ncbi:MAG TPA: hypothetical protein VLX28_04810 [Thermoanaerobaculia bacterium]|nr:hypothetical protein [Thermoanaerobaculia bacterium]